MLRNLFRKRTPSDAARELAKASAEKRHAKQLSERQRIFATMLQMQKDMAAKGMFVKERSRLV